MTSISVVLTTFERRELLRLSLDAIAAQSRMADEVIVVDDGSQDGTSEMLRADYPWVRLVQQDNTGLAAARNHGIAVARGDWIAFCDDDDLWLPNKLESLLPVLVSSDRHAVYHPVQPFDGAQPIGPPVHGEDVGDDSYRACLVRPPSIPSGMVVRRVVALRAGLFPPDVGYGEDWAFALNVARLVPWHLHPVPLTLVRVHPGQSSAAGHRRVRDSYVLAGVPLRVWYSGRPLPRRVTIEEQRQELARLGPTYRELFRGHFRETLGRRSWSEAVTFWRVLTLLLPRARDRVFVLVPGSGRLARLAGSIRSQRAFTRPRPARGDG